MTRVRHFWSLAVLGILGIAALALVSTNPSRAQETVPPFDFSQGLGNQPGLGGEGPVVSLKASYELTEGTSDGRMTLEVTIEPGWNIYSTTQAPGGPLPSVFRMLGVKGAKLTAIPRPDKPPKSVLNDEEFKGVVQEKHFDKVVWTAPLVVPAGFDPKTAKLQVEYDGLACSTSCVPQQATADAEFAGFKKTASRAQKYQGRRIHATVEGAVQPSVAKPGDKVRLSLTAKSEPGWHVYKYEPKPLISDVKKNLGYSPTFIAIDPPVRWTVSPATTSAKLIEHADEEGKILPYYEGEVTWDVEIQIPKDAVKGQYQLHGMASYQTCNEDSCDAPHDVKFDFIVEVGSASRSTPTILPIAFGKGTFGGTEVALAKLVGTADKVASSAPGSPSKGAPETRNLIDGKFELEESNLNFAQVFGIALLGGLILNVMPCVLPVIGLKIMSFVNQAGEQRSKVLTLNVVYAMGIMAVFMVLATLTVAAQYRWGEQNSSNLFNIVMVSIIFTMGLSFIGVWEIPIPGFVGSGKAAQMSEKEGLAGAFIKGTITTLLAIPCVAPFMGTALAWCLGKPTPIVYATFAALGLGMASPYLLIGAFPAAIRFLPKPGLWMETFKQVMGFMLLGTVVWIFSYMDWPYIVPTFGFLISLWIACWWVGSLPFTMERQRKVVHWAGAAFVPALVGIIMFNTLTDVMMTRFDAAASQRANKLQEELAQMANDTEVQEDASELPWQPFTREKLNEDLVGGRTVLVDFTADWCANCIFLERTVLNTKAIKAIVDKNNISTLVADYTKRPEGIRKTMNQFRGGGVPLLIIFPGHSPTKPIVFRNGYSKATLIETLEEAGPSKTPGNPVAAK